MNSEISLILTLSILIWISPFVAKLFRMPTPPIEILLGSIFAYSGLLYKNSYFDLIAQIGFLYLMFLAGMEVNLKQIAGSSGKMIKSAAMFIITMVILAVTAGVVLNFDPIVIISLPLISIGMLAPLVKTYGKKTSWLRQAIIVGVLGEIVSITALTVLDAAGSVGFSWKLLIEVGYLALFIFLIYILYRLLHLLFWWFPELKNILMPRADTSDQDIRLAMSLFFILISLMLALKLELALGAFIGGVAISAFFHHEKSLEEKMSSLGFGFLVPIFFIHVGTSFDLNSLVIPGVLSGGALIMAVMILIRIISAFQLRRISGSEDAFLVALSLSMPLTLFIAVATIGYTTNNIGILVYYKMILASLFEIIFSMTVIKVLLKRKISKREK